MLRGMPHGDIRRTATAADLLALEPFDAVEIIVAEIFGLEG
jgi:hypothetical protein